MWPTWRHDLAALGACLALGWLGLRGERVPLLAGADLGFHELGHLVCYLLDALLPWTEVLTAAAGSIFQVGVPVGLALYFLLARHDRVGGSVCLAWAATSAADVARYVADAPHEALPLIGGKHDWATILGPEHLDRLDAAADWAAAVDRLAWTLFALALVVALASLFVALAGPSRVSATSPRGGLGVDPKDVRQSIWLSVSEGQGQPRDEGVLSSSRTRRGEPSRRGEPVVRRLIAPGRVSAPRQVITRRLRRALRP